MALENSSTDSARQNSSIYSNFVNRSYIIGSIYRLAWNCRVFNLIFILLNGVFIFVRDIAIVIFLYTFINISE